MTSQADAFHYTGRVLDAAEAWQRGDRASTWKALAGVPVKHALSVLLTLVDVLAHALSNQTSVPASVLVKTARTEMLKAEHDQ